MGVKDFFTKVLPRFSPHSLRSKHAVEAGYVIIADLSTLVFHLRDGLPVHLANQILKSVPLEQGCIYIWVSDNEQIQLPFKDLTRASRPRTEGPDWKVKQVHDHSVELEDGSHILDPVKATDFMSHGNRSALFTYLKHFLLERVKIPEATTQVLIHHDSDAAEADVAIANRIEDHKATGRFLVRTDDSDVVVILVTRFRAQLLAKQLSIVVDRGGERKDRYVDIAQLADDLETKRITPDVFLTLCVCLGTDYSFKQWLSPRIGPDALIDRLFVYRDQFAKLDPREYSDFVTLVRRLVQQPVDPRCPVPMRLKRLAKTVVPWDYIQFNFHYWHPRTRPAGPTLPPPRLSLATTGATRCPILPDSCTPAPIVLKSPPPPPLSPVLCDSV